MRRLIMPVLMVFAYMKTAVGQTTAVHVCLDPGTTYQTIDNFSASDAWSVQFVGNWPEQKRNAMADWLFSTDTSATGNPIGIGLSMWRFNIGAGSAEQGDSSAIRDEWRRANEWQRQSGQLWFLEAARKRKVNQFLAFLNSPPVNLTLNGKAFAYNGISNISPEKYDALATYIANALTGIRKKTGIHFDYISPINEPQWDWSDGKQEGCPYDNEQISGVTKSLSRTLRAKKINTKILIGEAGKLDYLYSAADKPAKGKQVSAFFDPSSALYVGNLPNVSRTIAGHSYFTTSPASVAVSTREAVAKSVAAVPGLGFWQSEYCILGDNAGEINGNKRDYGMEAALYLATVIHRDLAIANARAWQYWLAISPYDYKDGLIYIDRKKSDGAYHDSKMLWAMGNYSRFIRPGAQRIAAQLQGDSTLLVSAYKNADKSICMVIVNNSQQEKQLVAHTSDGSISRMRTYVTSDAGSLQPLPVKDHIIIPARAVVTVTGSIKP
ncbi:glycoside hydrolase family 30 protein [Chitinophaga rhizophila]|uniref:Xylanase n=1 Tax=Chitinophaga rhizophila TaxID=2866212 RepID=A0ABS7GKG4_9BACT|nr:glycoside hydrolase family 30 protein [Chitinophaga rhizophila]MBW8687137.1 xylanase [Chitinophaga rhizophila]